MVTYFRVNRFVDKISAYDGDVNTSRSRGAG